jgi:phosphoserine phosphatase
LREDEYRAALQHLQQTVIPDAGETIGFLPWATEIRAVFCDMDATVICEESMELLAQEAGCSDTVHKLTEQAMAGQMDFAASLQQRLALLAGFPFARVTQLATTVTLRPGVLAFLRLFQQRGIPVYVVSGGFTPFAEWVCQQIGCTDFVANRFEVKKGKLTGHYALPLVDATYKLAWMEKICAASGISASMCVGIGDGANDLPLLERVGVSVGICPKPAIWKSLQLFAFSGSYHPLRNLFSRFFEEVHR